MSFDYLYALKNEPFIFESLDLLQKNGKLSSDVMGILLSTEKCYELFSCYNAILREAPLIGNIPNELVEDEKGHPRYYKRNKRFIHNEKAYVVCSQWFSEGREGNNIPNRPPFTKWLISLLNL